MSSATPKLLISAEEVGLLTSVGKLLSLAEVGLLISSTIRGFLTSFAEVGLLMSSPARVLLTSTKDVGLPTSLRSSACFQSFNDVIRKCTGSEASLSGQPNKALCRLRLIPTSRLVILELCRLNGSNLVSSVVVCKPGSKHVFYITLDPLH